MDLPFLAPPLSSGIVSPSHSVHDALTCKDFTQEPKQTFCDDARSQICFAHHSFYKGSLFSITANPTYQIMFQTGSLK